MQITAAKPSLDTSFSDMEIGQIGRITDPAPAGYAGHVVLRAYSGWVSLTNPEKTWNSGSYPSFTVTLFPVGTVLTLTLDV